MDTIYHHLYHHTIFFFLEFKKNRRVEAEAKADCVQVEIKRDGTFQSGHCETPKLAELLFLPAENFCGC